MDIGERFNSRWQFPNCGGAIDGKHIRITCPAKTGAFYYNYKKFYSIVLMALVNSDYEFLYVDVGKNGRNSDGAILEYTKFYQYLRNNQLQLPLKEENIEQMNYVFLGDEAFALQKHILRPFSQSELTYKKRIFNYRLSRARNVVENTFGLITARFRILHTAITVQPENAKDIIIAICVLHNFLCRKSKSYFNRKTVDSENKITHDIKIDGEWRNNAVELYGFEKKKQTNVLVEAKQTRQEYLDFFNGNGSVTWQENMIENGKA